MRIACNLLTFVLLLTLQNASQSQERFRILAEDFHSDKTNQMMRSYLRTQVHRALDARNSELNAALSSRQGIREYQAKRRDYLEKVFGGRPRLDAQTVRVTGTITGEQFTIEKVLFESQPGLIVTANLYRPAGDGPFPSILHPCGHTEDGKANPTYQRVNQLLVRHGFLVLCFDPVGQGERKQMFTEKGQPTHRASSEHQQLGIGANLLGEGLGTYMVWDAMCAIDYLTTRSDVDVERIGCTGNSGGGNLTSFLMAYDDRIAVAAPGCFMTTHRHKNERPGPGDAEQNLFGQIQHGFDLPDFLIARAPKPTLILSATQDFVPIDGAWEAFRDAKRVYSKLGRPECIQLVEADEKHGFTEPLRLAASQFFARWLQAKNLDVRTEPPVRLRTAKELQVTRTGQTRDEPGAQLLGALMHKRCNELQAKRDALSKQRIRKATGIRQLKHLPHPKVVRTAGANGITLLKIHPERGITLPALHWSQGQKAPIVLAPHGGMNSVVQEASRLNAAGHPVLVVEVRDTGETSTRNWRFQGAENYIAMMLGRNWLAMRSEDLLVASRWLSKQHASKAVNLRCDGAISLCGLHAAALEPTLISKLKTHGGLKSWLELLDASNPYEHAESVVPGVLKFYDLPELRAFVPKGAESR